jgi:hypothetical protein
MSRPNNSNANANEIYSDTNQMHGIIIINVFLKCTKHEE